MKIIRIFSVISFLSLMILAPHIWAMSVTETVKIVAPDAAEGDRFGKSLAVSGTTLVVGVPGPNNAGAVYVYECPNSFSCTQVSKLAVSDATEKNLGTSVAISGSNVVVNGLKFAYYFNLSGCGAVCTETRKLIPSDKGHLSGTLDGRSIAISGANVLVGVPRDSKFFVSSGSSYYYNLSNLNCNEEGCTENAKLTASVETGSEKFGISVAIDGMTAVIGGLRPTTGGIPVEDVAYYFNLSNCKEACTESGQLKTTTAPLANGFSSRFGRSVAISGMTAVIGAPQPNKVYYFDLLSCGAECTETGELVPSSTGNVRSGRFGDSLAISGMAVVVGDPEFIDLDPDPAQPQLDPVRSGSAHYFNLSSCGAECTEIARLTASDAESQDKFGTSVAISEMSVVVGAPEDDNATERSGSAYIFKLGDTDSTGNLTAFIQRLYQNILGRAADTAGLEYWKDVLKTQSAAFVIQQFIYSSEYTDLNLDDDAFVDTLYWAILDRDADIAGKAYWLSALENGTLRDMVLYGFLLSQEMSDLADRFSVTAFNENDNALYQIKLFVIRFYELALLRNPDVEGYNYWTEQLANGTQSASGIAKGFFFSNEFINKNYDDNAFVEMAYQTILNRVADQGGKVFWLNQLAIGLTRFKLINGFIVSQEFQRLAASYGIRVQ